MKKVLIEVTNVDWDAPKSVKKSLSTNFTFSFDMDEEDAEDDFWLEDLISDKLSDEVGYTHNGFDYVRLN